MVKTLAAASLIMLTSAVIVAAYIYPGPGGLYGGYTSLNLALLPALLLNILLALILLTGRGEISHKHLLDSLLVFLLVFALPAGVGFYLRSFAAVRWLPAAAILLLDAIALLRLLTLREGMHIRLERCMLATLPVALSVSILTLAAHLYFYGGFLMPGGDNWRHVLILSSVSRFDLSNVVTPQGFFIVLEFFRGVFGIPYVNLLTLFSVLNFFLVVSLGYLFLSVFRVGSRLFLLLGLVLVVVASPWIGVLDLISGGYSFPLFLKESIIFFHPSLTALTLTLYAMSALWQETENGFSLKGVIFPSLLAGFSYVLHFPASVSGYLPFAATVALLRINKPSVAAYLLGLFAFFSLLLDSILGFPTLRYMLTIVGLEPRVAYVIFVASLAVLFIPLLRRVYPLVNRGVVIVGLVILSLVVLAVEYASPYKPVEFLGSVGYLAVQSQYAYLILFSLFSALNREARVLRFCALVFSFVSSFIHPVRLLILSNSYWVGVLLSAERRRKVSVILLVAALLLGSAGFFKINEYFFYGVEPLGVEDVEVLSAIPSYGDAGAYCLYGKLVGEEDGLDGGVMTVASNFYLSSKFLFNLRGICLSLPIDEVYGGGAMTLFDRQIMVEVSDPFLTLMMLSSYGVDYLISDAQPPYGGGHFLGYVIGASEKIGVGDRVSVLRLPWWVEGPFRRVDDIIFVAKLDKDDYPAVKAFAELGIIPLTAPPHYLGFVQDWKLVVIHDQPYLLEFLEYLRCGPDSKKAVIIISGGVGGSQGVKGFACPVYYTPPDSGSIKRLILSYVDGYTMGLEEPVSLLDLDYYFFFLTPVFRDVQLSGNISLLDRWVSLPRFRGERMTLVWGAGDYVIADVDGVYVLVSRGTVIEAVLEDALAFHKRTRLWHLETGPERGLWINATLFRGYQQYLLLRCNGCGALSPIDMARVTYEK